MALLVWCEIVCAWCANTSAGQYVSGGKFSVREMKSNAKAEGYIFKGKNAFCCMPCKIQYEREYQE